MHLQLFCIIFNYTHCERYLDFCKRLPYFNFTSLNFDRRNCLITIRVMPFQHSGWGDVVIDCKEFCSPRHISQNLLVTHPSNVEYSYSLTELFSFACVYRIIYHIIIYYIVIYHIIIYYIVIHHIIIYYIIIYHIIIYHMQ